LPTLPIPGMRIEEDDSEKGTILAVRNVEEEELRIKILQYLESHHTMSLATVHEGVPHSATVYYVNIGFKLYF